MNEKIKILIADDHPLYREGIKQTLAKIECVISECSNGEEAIKLILEQKPDVAIVDLRMPVKSGLDVLSELAGGQNNAKIILLTMYENLNYFYQAVSFGAKGYLLKGNAVDELIPAVKEVFAGGVFVSVNLRNEIDSVHKKEYEHKALIFSINTLTEAEKKIVKLVGDWKTNGEIAELLSISKRTVENHRAHISEKLNLRGTHSLIRFAIQNREFF
ncbi:MAG: response regulator transcription factor [Chlorobi bacterium]|nr:response regulator transcription factor [Chlorobiota bacterium]